MKTQLYKLTVLPLIIMGLLLLANKSFGQQQAYVLDNILKIELITKAGGVTEDVKKVEVIRDGDSWKSYQTNLIRGQVRSSSKELDKSSS